MFLTTGSHGHRTSHSCNTKHKKVFQSLDLPTYTRPYTSLPLGHIIDRTLGHILGRTLDHILGRTHLIQG